MTLDLYIKSTVVCFGFLALHLRFCFDPRFLLDMGLQEDFEKASKDALDLPPTTTDEDKLILYGLFKQATVGDVNTNRPGLFDLKGKAKWDSWKSYSGKTKEEAQQEYITKVTQLQEA